MNKNLRNQHGIISIHGFSSGPALFIIEFSIGVHGFRQNHYTPHRFHFDKFILHWLPIRYRRNLCLILFGIERLSNQHGIIPIRRFFNPLELFIIEFSIGVHQFRQNIYTLYYFHSTINKIFTGDIFGGLLVLFVPETKKLSEKHVITSIH